MNIRIWVVLLSAVAVGVSAPPTSVQHVPDSALVAGTVTDESGTVNSGTNETLLNVYRGPGKNLTNSETGNYVCPNIRQAS